MINAAVLGALDIAKNKHTSLQHQLASALRVAMIEGRIPPQSRLPSSRSLARELGVSRNTVVSAFEQLISEGYLIAQQGSGTKVADFNNAALAYPAKPPARMKDHGEALTPSFSAVGSPAILADHPIRRKPRTAPAFTTGLADMNRFPLGPWSRILGRTMRNADHSLLDDPDPGGHPALRQQIANHLSQTRGVNCNPEQIVVTNGAQAALDMIMRLVIQPGDHVLIEEPSYPGAWSAAKIQGARLVPVKLDQEGIDLSQISTTPCPVKLMFVTPSYQYPLGITMSLTRRIDLLDFANRNDCWILEDDYDSDLRYRGRPLAALQGLDQSERVIYTGTFSKSMFAGLRIGYVVAPYSLLNPICALMRSTGQQPSAILQCALATFMQEGLYGSHIRAMQKHYFKKQQSLIAALQLHTGNTLSVDTSDAGMQLVAWLKRQEHAASIKKYVQKQNPDIKWVSDFHLGECKREGLLLGYAGLQESSIDSHCRLLAAMLSDFHSNKKCLES